MPFTADREGILLGIGDGSRLHFPQHQTSPIVSVGFLSTGSDVGLNSMYSNGNMYMENASFGLWATNFQKPKLQEQIKLPILKDCIIVRVPTGKLIIS